MASTAFDPRGVVAIETHGCKLNQADSEALARAFLSAGYSIAQPGERAGPDLLQSNCKRP